MPERAEALRGAALRALAALLASLGLVPLANHLGAGPGVPWWTAAEPLLSCLALVVMKAIRVRRRWTPGLSRDSDFARTQICQKLGSTHP